MSIKSDGEKKEGEVAERTAPAGDIVYQAIFDEGEENETESRTRIFNCGGAEQKSDLQSLPRVCVLRVSVVK